VKRPSRNARNVKKAGRQLVILTGISGSGKSTVLRAFEDMGYYCVDNLPVELIPIFAELHAAGEGDFARAALLVDAREGLQLAKFPALLRHLQQEHPIILVFIEAQEDALLRRYSETRRPHPLGKDYSVRESLHHEKVLMEPIRKLADLMFDVRFLPNPHFVPKLRPFTGKDPKVRRYIESFPQTGEFLRRMTGLLTYLIPHYIEEGKSYLTIAFGCTGGKHRSVMMAEWLKKALEKKGFDTRVMHRDIDK
jgi:UPF0042 nucleotide-binding protein